MKERERRGGRERVNKREGESRKDRDGSRERVKERVGSGGEGSRPTERKYFLQELPVQQRLI